MITFHVEDMTCGHCAQTITGAIEAIDGHAKVTVDAARHLVVVERARADVNALRGAIAEAGYTPTPVQTEAAASTKAGGCCGCR